MSNNNDSKNVSNQTIDMLVGSILKKHGAKLEAEKVGPKEKEELKNMINNLTKSVEAITAEKKVEKKEEKE